MAQVKTIVRVDLDPSQPVSEICATINAITIYQPQKEAEILQGVKDAIERRLKQLKGVDGNGKPLRESDRKQQN